MPDIKIQIKNLYKIFGSNDKTMISHVEGGMGKPELLEQHHILNGIHIFLHLFSLQAVGS